MSLRWPTITSCELYKGICFSTFWKRALLLAGLYLLEVRGWIPLTELGIALEREGWRFWRGANNGFGGWFEASGHPFEPTFTHNHYYIFLAAHYTLSIYDLVNATLPRPYHPPQRPLLYPHDSYIRLYLERGTITVNWSLKAYSIQWPRAERVGDRPDSRFLVGSAFA